MTTTQSSGADGCLQRSRHIARTGSVDAGLQEQVAAGLTGSDANVSAP
jgi:hypothetical protein